MEGSVNTGERLLWEKRARIMQSRRAKLPTIDPGDKRGNILNHVLKHGAAWEEEDSKVTLILALRTPSSKKKEQKARR